MIRECSFMESGGEIEFVKKILLKIEVCLREAYYSTPPHIASKTLVYRALLLARNGISFLDKKCRE